jgi:hypothetical protein
VPGRWSGSGEGVRGALLGLDSRASGA